MSAATDAPAVSVVVPVFNERDNIPPLIAEIVAALRGVAPFEIVYVDDRSKDDSWEVLQAHPTCYEMVFITNDAYVFVLLCNHLYP